MQIEKDAQIQSSFFRVQGDIIPVIVPRDYWVDDLCIWIFNEVSIDVGITISNLVLICR